MAFLEENYILLVSCFVIVVLVILILKKSIIIVPQSYAVIIERFGKYRKTLHSGINFIFPFMDKPKTAVFQLRSQSVETNKHMTLRRGLIDIREQMLDYEKQKVITKDNVTLAVDPILYFQIVDVAKAFYEVSNFPNAIEQITKTALRNIIGSLELDQVLSAREQMNEQLRKNLDEATDKWGVKVTRVELQEIDPPENIKEDLEKQLKAERERRAQVLAAEGLKQQQVLESEGKKQSKLNIAEAEKNAAIAASEAEKTAIINKAEAERQAILLRAEAEAEAKKKQAEAEAAIIELTKKAFGNDEEYGKYMIAMKYVQALSEMTSGKDNKVIYMPYEATGIISSLGGLKEMLEKVRQ